VIGENASRSLVVGGGSSSLKVAYEQSPLDGLIAKYGKDHIVYSLGYASGPALYGREEPSKLNTDSLLTAAVELAKQADIVLFIGGLNKNHFQDCEGGDRQSLSLPFGQDKLIDALLKANKNTAVVLLSGNAVSMPWINKVPAIVQGWYLGSEAGNVLADVISGEVNPSGKLPFSFPKKLEDNAAHFYGKISYPGDSVNQYYKEDIMVGYRWFDTKKISPQFPFGFGLSYTSFDLGALSSDKLTYGKDEVIRIKFMVKNTGSRYGAEVAQLYVHDPVCTVPRPVKELKAFEKVFLQPGETKTVELALKAADLAFYDVDKQDWNVEAGDFILQLGNSSGNISQKLMISVK
jgi:beta-glucosidase